MNEELEQILENLHLGEIDISKAHQQILTLFSVRLSLQKATRLLELSVRIAQSCGEMEGILYGVNEDEEAEYHKLVDEYLGNEA